jgi:hypothetical protein
METIMTTLTAATQTSVSSATGPRTAITGAGLAAAVACAANIAGWFLLADLSHAQLDRAPVTIVEALIAGLAFLGLAVSLPGLASSTRLPRWALTLAAVACGFIAIPAWAFGSIVAHLATQLPEAQFDAVGEPTLLLMLLNLPAMALGLIAFVALAIVGWRNRAMSRGACILLFIAGLVALIPDFPPVGLLAGLAFAWTARSSRPVESSRPAESSLAVED